MGGDGDNCGNKVSSGRQSWPRQPAPGEEGGATKGRMIPKDEKHGNLSRWTAKHYLCPRDMKARWNLKV